MGSMGTDVGAAGHAVRGTLLVGGAWSGQPGLISVVAPVRYWDFSTFCLPGEQEVLPGPQMCTSKRLSLESV